MDIVIGGTISKLTAARIGSLGINAQRLDSLSATGDSRAGISGDLSADIFLDNAGATGEVKALGTAKVAGVFKNATIKTAGSVGSFSAAVMQNAELFVGFTATTTGQPLSGGAFTAEAQLGTPTTQCSVGRRLRGSFRCASCDAPPQKNPAKVQKWLGSNGTKREGVRQRLGEP